MRFTAFLMGTALLWVHSSSRSMKMGGDLVRPHFCFIIKRTSRWLLLRSKSS